MVMARRQVLGGAMATAMLLPPRPALAQISEGAAGALRSLIPRHWQGVASTPDPKSLTGLFVIRIATEFRNVTSSLAFDGSVGMTATIDDIKYQGNFAITGHGWSRGTKLGIWFDSFVPIGGSTLPRGLYWQGLKGELEFFRQEGKPNNFLLAGMLHGINDGAIFETELADD